MAHAIIEVALLVPDWPVIATETLKLIAGAGVAIGLGLLAHHRGWIGQKDWDTTKFRYEIFKEEQRSRLALLADMRIEAATLEDAVLCALSAEMIRSQLALKHGKDMSDSQMQRETKRAVSESRRMNDALDKLELLARRYGLAPETEKYHQCSMSEVVRDCKVRIEQLRHNAAFDWEQGRSDLLNTTGSLSTVLYDVTVDEQDILLHTLPADVSEVFRNRLPVRVFHNLRVRKTKG